MIHYYVKAEDDAGGDVRSATLPSDLNGFDVFPGDPGYDPYLWPSAFSVRGLPTMHSASPGDQPGILFYDDAESNVAATEWTTSLANLGFEEGVHYDLYHTNSASSGVSNGLGARATVPQIAGYQTLLYHLGSLSAYGLNTFDQDNDKSDDIALLEAWLAWAVRTCWPQATTWCSTWS